MSLEGVRGRKRRSRIGGGKALSLEDFTALIAYGNNELGAAGFDGTE